MDAKVKDPKIGHVCATEVKMCVNRGNACLMKKLANNEEKTLIVTLKFANESYLLSIVDCESAVWNDEKKKNEPFVMWAKKFVKCDTAPGKMTYADAAYQKYLYLIGKMCKKDMDSKYFGNHVYSEHKSNGCVNDITDEDFEKIIAYSAEMYEKLNKS